MFRSLVLAGLGLLSVHAAASEWIYHEQFESTGNQKIFSSRTTFPLNSAGKIEGVARNTIYITIDDGPTGSATPKILDVLKRYNVPATFFVVGKNVRAYPALVRRAYEEGHLVANHTYAHELDFSTPTSFYNSLLATDQLITPFQDGGQIQLFRAPGGVWNTWRQQIGNDHSVLRDYVGPIYWNVGGGNPKNNNDADWKCWSKGVSVSSCAASYLAQIRSNYARGTASLFLMHDVNSKSAALLETVLSSLKNDRIDWDFRLVDEIPAVRDAQ